MISRPSGGGYNQRGVKLSTRIEEGRFGAAPHGFSECFRAFDEEFEYVCRSLRRHGVKPGDAEDLAQDVLIVVWRRWRDYDRGRPLRAWLSGIAARVARDHLRRRWREIPHGQIEIVDPTLVGEDQVESSRTRTLVMAALAALPDRHRLAIVLHDVQGLSPSAIARAMGVPVSTAYTRLRRAHLAFAREVVRARKRRERRPARRVLLVGLALAAAALLVVGLRPRPAPVVARSRPAVDLRAGLVGYWPFDDPPGSPVARDRSGAGLPCLLHDLDPWRAWTTGAVGGAVDLRGGGWLECPQPAVAAGRPAPDMTVMVRVKAALTEAAHGAVVTRELGSEHDDLFFFGFVGDRLKISSRAWLGWVSRPVPSARDRWAHIAFTRRAGGPTRLYLDGVEVGANQQGERPLPAGGAPPLTVGGGHPGLGGGEIRQHFAGLVDELAVYDRALRPEEIAAAAGAPLTL